MVIRPVSVLLLRYTSDHFAITVQQYGTTCLFAFLKLKSPFFRQMYYPTIEAASPVRKEASLTCNNLGADWQLFAFDQITGSCTGALESLQCAVRMRIQDNLFACIAEPASQPECWSPFPSGEGSAACSQSSDNHHRFEC